MFVSLWLLWDRMQIAGNVIFDCISKAFAVDYNQPHFGQYFLLRLVGWWWELILTTKRNYHLNFLTQFVLLLKCWLHNFYRTVCNRGCNKIINTVILSLFLTTNLKLSITILDYNWKYEKVWLVSHSLKLCRSIQKRYKGS